MCNIGFVTEDGRFRFRGVGIVIKDGKVLMVHDEERHYYYAIGGAVKIGEKASDAAVREVYEESGLKVEIDRLVLVQENFFELEDGIHHELAFYYLMKDIGAQRVAGDRVLDCSEEGLKWIDIEKISDYKIYPQIYNNILKDIPTEIVHSVVDDRRITRK